MNRPPRVRSAAVVLVFAILITVVGLFPSPAGATGGEIVTFTAATVSSPWDIAAGPDGNVWFTSHYNHRIGRLTPAGPLPLPTPTPTRSRPAQDPGPRPGHPGQRWGFR